MIIFDILNSIAPVLGYISQLQLIKKQKSLGSFSIDVCAIISIASIMRIFFWFAKGFALSLLFQAIFLIVVMIILLYQCVHLTSYEKEKFWRWNKFGSYLKFLLILSAVLTVITLVCVVFDIDAYGDVIGFLSLSLQSLLGFPQMISNQRTHSVEGLSYAMIFSWVAGDTFKTVYFIMNNQPFQFIMCGSIQLLVDMIIITQIYFFQNKKYQSFIKIDQKPKVSQK